MNLEIKTLPDFDKTVRRLAKKYKSLPSDLKNLFTDLKKDPHTGIEIMPGLRKVRMAITSKGKGKSGGARIITYDVCERRGRITLFDLHL